MNPTTGVIICGFPGIGKSSCAGWNRCIDLESSDFSQAGIKDWPQLYVNTAINLAKQGFTVFVSTHKQVRYFLIQYQERCLKFRQLAHEVPVVIFCPQLNMKEAWIERLRTRYEKTKLTKDLHALRHAETFWEESITEMENCGLPVVKPSAMDYDLKDYIYYIQGIHAHNGQHDPLHMLRYSITATNTQDPYSVGLRNGMRFAISLIDGKDPVYEKLPEKRPLSKEEVMARKKVIDYAWGYKKGESHGKDDHSDTESNVSPNQPQAETVEATDQAPS